MKKNLRRSLEIAALFISVGLMTVFTVFFLLFGKGLQILMPLLLFTVFFLLFFLLEKIPFISKHPIIKLMIATAFIIVAILML